MYIKEMSFIEDFIQKIDNFLSSGYSTATGWIDISERFGLCRGCISFYPNPVQISIFGRTLHVSNNRLNEEQRKDLRHVLIMNQGKITRIQSIMAREDYKELVRKGRGHLTHYGEGADTTETMWQYGLQISYRRALVSHFLDSDIFTATSPEKQIEMLNALDDDLYKIGALFADAIGDLYVTYFRVVHKEVGRFCIRFMHPDRFTLSDVNPRLPLIFTQRKNKLYFKDVNELETLLSLAGLT